MQNNDANTAEVPPLLHAAFLPARWFRWWWRSGWFRLAVLVFLFVVVVGSVVLWSGCAASTGWDQWLARLRPTSSGSSNKNAKFGLRPSMKKLAYHGDGRAELGQFSVRMFDPLTKITLRADFKLEGKTDCGDETTFQRFMTNNNRFFREQVTVTLRTCPPEELIDADPDLLERKLVSRVNRSLGREFLASAELKDFALYESINKSGFVRMESNAHQPSTKAPQPEVAALD